MDTLAFQGLGSAVTQDVAPAPRAGLVLRMQQTLCGWSRDGHQMILARDRQRLFLVCCRCLHESPGWSIDRR